jgi:hypothetical protein
MNGTLNHIGILGMRWGVRRGSSSTSDGGSGIHKLLSLGSADHEKVIGIKKKKISEMSNDELKVVANRIILEKQYRDLNPEKVNKGKKYVSELLVNTGKMMIGNVVADVGKRGASEISSILIKRLFSGRP